LPQQPAASLLPPAAARIILQHPHRRHQQQPTAARIILQQPASSRRIVANVKFIRGVWQWQPTLKKNESVAVVFSAIFPLVGFLLRGNCRNQ